MRERLFLPPFLYGCTGIEMNLYFANVFTCINPGNYVFKFHCEIGRCDQERWRCIPRQEETGVHEARLEVISEDGVVAEGECRLVICSPDKASDRKLRLMMVGDSLTDQTWYPAHIHTLCRKYNIDLTMVGTNIPEQLRELPGQLIEYPDRELLYGVRHEGWGGWSAATFLYRKAPIESEIYYHWNRSSPFLNDNGEFDFKGYLDKNCGGIAPDIIMISLGGNDMININSDNCQEIMENYLHNMEILYRNLRKDAPRAFFGIGIEPYGSMDQTAWGKNYGCKLYAWDRRCLVPQAYRQLTELFANKPDCSMVPLYTAVDPIYGYPRHEGKCFEESADSVVCGNNALHPQPAGYHQAANCAFGWLLDTLEKRFL